MIRGRLFPDRYLHPIPDFVQQGLLLSVAFVVSGGGGGGSGVRRCWVNFQCRGVLLIWNIVGQGPIALVVGAGGVVWTFFLSSITSLFFLPLSGRRPDID